MITSAQWKDDHGSACSGQDTGRGTKCSVAAADRDQRRIDRANRFGYFRAGKAKDINRHTRLFKGGAHIVFQRGAEPRSRASPGIDEDRDRTRWRYGKR